MQFTTVRSKEKDYDIYLKSEKTGSQPVRARKKCFQLFGNGKTWFLAISILTNTVAAIWREKKVDTCYLESKKMQFTTVRSKVKDYDIYLKSEKVVHSQQEHEKMFPSYLEVQKTGSQLFRALQTLLQLFRERNKWIPAIWIPKNVVHNCQEQGKRL